MLFSGSLLVMDIGSVVGHGALRSDSASPVWNVPSCPDRSLLFGAFHYSASTMEEDFTIRLNIF